jgi:high affinity Mn2+ porin
LSEGDLVLTEAGHRFAHRVGRARPHIGDRRLAYGEEKIFEAYYSYWLKKWSVLTLDYQFISGPAYHADRAPVSIFSARAHAEF